MENKKILIDFRRFYNIEQFDLKQIDQYLWQAGKKYFHKNHSTSSNKN